MLNVGSAPGIVLGLAVEQGRRLEEREEACRSWGGDVNGPRSDPLGLGEPKKRGGDDRGL